MPLRSCASGLKRVNAACELHGQAVEREDRALAVCLGKEAEGGGEGEETPSSSRSKIIIQLNILTALEPQVFLSHPQLECPQSGSSIPRGGIPSGKQW